LSEWYRKLWQPEGPNGVAYRALSALLAPAEGSYRMAVSVRGWAYDRGLFASKAGGIPTLVVGNLTVGGTGKTPVAAWFASRLAELGERPAIVLRGYGGDETKVHRVLNPDLPVYAYPDRWSGVERAGAEGSRVAVLDDAFQHRALRPDASVVLVSAEEYTDRPRLLPRGPWREPLRSLDRATLVVVTRKRVSEQASVSVAQRLADRERAVPQARAYIGMAGLAGYDASSGALGEAQALEGFQGTLAVAGVAHPESVWAQLRDAGVTVERRLAFPDHHRYSSEDVRKISSEAAGGVLIATLKDAVKLGSVLDPAVAVYVPVQEVLWESGRQEIDCLLAKLLERRSGAVDY